MDEKEQPQKIATPNRIARHIGKSPDKFTSDDLISFIGETGIRMIAFNYIGGDGRLKTLNFAIQGEQHLKQLLAWGERVDGSSLFPYIDPGNSDLYVIPRFKTAFVDPFAKIPTLNLLCAFFDGKGQRPSVVPENLVGKAHAFLEKETGIRLHALGELEYYVIYEPGKKELYPARAQKNYHESKPFSKFEDLNIEMLDTMASVGIPVKYGHAEVGAIVLSDGKRAEQYEIELNLEPLEDMADHLVLAKWVMRNVAAKHGVEITFAPKISVGHAGTGLHIHIAAIKEHENVMCKGEALSRIARKMIGGLIRFAPSLTAFGNTNPTSYLRLVPHQEAPTNVCWGDKNRSVLIRVPLGWRDLPHLSNQVNQPNESVTPNENRQTIELRSPDGSANVHYLLAGIAAAIHWSLTQEEAEVLAEDYYVEVNIFHEEHKHIQERMAQLPSSCWESAARLEVDAQLYAEYGQFEDRLIGGLVENLRDYDDRDLQLEMKRDTLKAEEHMQKFLHTG